MKYEFDKDKLSKDLKIAKNFDKLGSREAGKLIGIAHSTVHRVEHKKEIRIDTFIKVINWLKKKPTNYIRLKVCQKLKD